MSQSGGFEAWQGKDLVDGKPAADISSDSLMDELQTFLDMDPSPNPTWSSPSPLGTRSVPKQQEEVSLTSSASLSSFTDETDKQKCDATAARIQGALEASGLSGNLTSEDLQTLKRLNEIVKSTGLTQEQKSGEF